MKLFNKYETEVLILGGGVAGLSLSIHLKNKGIDSFILTEEDKVGFKIGESIHPSAKRDFGKLSLLDEELKSVSLPLIGHRSKWGNSLLSERNFLYEMFGFGYQIDRLKFETLLSNKSRNLFVKKIHAKSEGHSIKYHSDANELTFLNGNVEIKARKIVDCTGRRRILKSMWNQNIEKFDSLICVYSVFQKKHIDENDYFTLVESQENGWMYSGHLPGNKIVVCVFTDPKFVTNHIKDKNTFLLNSISNSIYTKIRLLKSEQKIISQLCSASSYLVKSTSIKNIFAHGDSAYTLDPLASFGIQKCLEDSDFLSNLISDELKNNADYSLDYNIYINNKYKQYLKEKRQIYSKEQKWKDNNFWKIRTN